MNLAQHALKSIRKVEPKKKKSPPKALKVMLDNKEKIEQIINSGGNVSTVAKHFGLAHVTIAKHIKKVVSEDMVKKAKDNGMLASVAAASGRKNPKEDLIQ